MRKAGLVEPREPQVFSPWWRFCGAWATTAERVREGGGQREEKCEGEPGRGPGPSGAGGPGPGSAPSAAPRRPHRSGLPAAAGLVRGMWVGLPPPRRLKTPLGPAHSQSPVPPERPRRATPATPGLAGRAAGRARWWCAASPAGGAGGSCPCCWGWPSSWASSPWRAGAGWSPSRSPTCSKRRYGRAARGARRISTGAANPSWTTVSEKPPEGPGAVGAKVLTSPNSVAEQLLSGMEFPSRTSIHTGLDRSGEIFFYQYNTEKPGC